MPAFDFKDQVVLITGGSSGIGRAISHQFATDGATVVMAARDPAKGEATRREIVEQGGRAEFVSIQLGDDAAVQALIKKIERDHGALHVIVNCAGGSDTKAGATDSSTVLERWNLMAASNLLGAYLVTTYGVEIMKRTGGAVVNISSTASMHGNYGLYGTMKAGLEGLTRSMAFDYASHRIRVNAIAPGWIKTPGTLPNPDDAAQAEWERTSASLLGRMGSVDDIACATLFLASPLAGFITGETLFVDGGLAIIDATMESYSRLTNRVIK
ncbi:MAG: SDR family NAD(P)-dependent oxidoreductase [Anaerolineales bacterium]